MNEKQKCTKCNGKGYIIIEEITTGPPSFHGCGFSMMYIPGKKITKTKKVNCRVCNNINWKLILVYTLSHLYDGSFHQ